MMTYNNEQAPEIGESAQIPLQTYELAYGTTDSETLVSLVATPPSDSPISATFVHDELLPAIQEKAIAYPGEAEEAIVRDEADDFPDGGVQAWLVVAGATSLTVASFGFVNAWGVFQFWAYYEADMLQNVSTSAISWIGSIQFSLTFLPCLIMGRLFDLGYFHIPLFISSTAIVVITFLVAECTEYWQFMLGQGIALGLASGFMYGPTVAVMGHWFKKRRSLAFGISAIGSSGGGTVISTAVSRLIPLVGFPWTMRIVGFILLTCIIFANLTMKRRLPPIHVTGGLLNLAAFKNTAYSIYTAATFTAFLGLYTTLTYLNTDADLIGLDPSFASYLTAIANGASCFGRFSSGLLADKFGPINTLVPFNILTAITTFIWPFCTSRPSIVVIAILYGFSSGAYAGIIAAPLAALGPIGDMGRRIGMTFSISGIAALCGPPISGAIRDRVSSFHEVGYYAGCIILVSTSLLIASKRAAIGTFLGRF